jgi:hypothetical protein
LVLCQTAFNYKGSRGKGYPSKYPGSHGLLRSHHAATIPVSTHHYALGNLVARFFITSILRRGVELAKCRRIPNTLPTGNPSVRAIPRPESPCVFSRATSSRYTSNVLGRPSLIPRRFAAAKPSWIASTAAACLNSSTASSVLRNTLGAYENRGVRRLVRRSEPAALPMPRRPSTARHPTTRCL